jgi:hypothetical protein
MRRLSIIRNTIEKKTVYAIIKIDLAASKFRTLEAKINKEGFSYFPTDAKANVADTEAQVTKEEDTIIANAFQQVTAKAKEKAKDKDKGKGKVKKIGWQPMEEQDKTKKIGWEPMGEQDAGQDVAQNEW